jgi:hypothetical protein
MQWSKGKITFTFFKISRPTFEPNEAAIHWENLAYTPRYKTAPGVNLKIYFNLLPNLINCASNLRVPAWCGT